MFRHGTVVLLWITTASLSSLLLQLVDAGPNCPGGGGDSTPAAAGRSGSGGYNACEKIEVCHNGRTIEVCEKALPGLENAGATKGPCLPCDGITHTPVGECQERCFDCNTCSDGYYDGCNTCTCDPSGRVLCTEIACAGAPFAQGEPYCLPGCTSKRLCQEPICNKDEILVHKGGECCPECIPRKTTCCCDPVLEPGKHDNPFCFEGHECCAADGTWVCSIGDAKTFPCGGELITDGFGKVCRGN